MTEQPQPDPRDIINQFFLNRGEGPKPHLWECPVCGHTFVAHRMPEPLFWSDGHCCRDWLPKD
jgi:hypothetical protein